MYMQSKVEGNASSVKVYPNREALDKIEKINQMNMTPCKQNTTCSCKEKCKSDDNTLLLLLLLLLCTK